MPTFTDVTTASLAVDQPITSAMMIALRDNALAAVWHPYNKSTIGDASTGLVYDFAVSGAVATVVTPDFEDGYEYKILLRGLSHNGGSSYDLLLEPYGQTSGAYIGIRSMSDVFSGATANIAGFIELPSVRASLRYHPMLSAIDDGSTGGPALAHVADLTTAQKVLRARLSWTSGASFDAGQIYLYRRGVFAV